MGTMKPLVLSVDDKTTNDGTRLPRCTQFHWYCNMQCLLLLLLCSNYVYGFTISARLNLGLSTMTFTRNIGVSTSLSATQIENAAKTASEHGSSMVIDTVPVQKADLFTFKINNRSRKNSTFLVQNVTTVASHDASSAESSAANLRDNDDKTEKVEDDLDEKSSLKTISATRAVAASLFQKHNDRSASSHRTSPTSIGDRRVGSATIHREQGFRATNAIMDVLRKTARGISSVSSSHPTEADCPPPTAKGDSLLESSNVPLLEPSVSPSGIVPRMSQSIIHSAIDELLRLRSSSSASTESATPKEFSQFIPSSAAFSSFPSRRMGILGDSITSKNVFNAKSTPIATCSYSTRSLSGASSTTNVNVRLAIPADDVDVAYLRMSVFSDITPDLRSQFCARSCQAIAARRLRGAICFVATQATRDAEHPFQEAIVGSAECSYHEFFGTKLGRRRQQNSLLYVTEVAVNPSVRRRGVGTAILQAIGTWAQQQSRDGYNIESLYLHVDVSNHNAIRMYEKAGFFKVLSEDAMFSEFTSVLNLQPGATHGREHYLLCKNLVSHPVWLKDRYHDENVGCIEATLATARGKYYPILGQFGIEIPA